MTCADSRERFMRMALLQAEKALGFGEVPVGCVFVYKPNTLDEEVIGVGCNQTNRSRNGTRHAELVAIDRILLEKGHSTEVFSECDLYVTCEPCIMCAAALGRVGVRKVIFGCHNTRFGGNGSILSLHHESPSPYEIESGILQDEAIQIFQKFYSGENERAPLSKRKRKKDDFELSN
mmetsp:Transcript_6832/g.10265  ORF Transcript_6832/g.10265 Transcript_6832/m.10265 type:complete len:177 (-) Transcript_6832:217-747(-)|eukprot:CAMPEP_0185022816 /NCGR_PEP_ID=MMETSP1103-20130426/5515_1 /TAXON_ID=36769 /ORGANISM="Paraphysomonas bandaiensis, Strain Caron Lab Isolate" /LENGTH=176 /DNA_ID=CAMNT_0027555061 /DNA_START=107 /DNA_END=637 /DNA_ORIENTATION=+